MNVWRIEAYFSRYRNGFVLIMYRVYSIYSLYDNQGPNDDECFQDDFLHNKKMLVINIFFYQCFPLKTSLDFLAYNGKRYLSFE